MPEHYPVIFASDERGVQPLGVAIYSLLEVADASSVYEVYVLSNGISEQSRKRLRNLFAADHARHSLVFVDVSNLPALSELPATARWPVSMWARVFIPELLPAVSGKVAYLDIDILVCQDLRELFHTPLNGKAIGVVLEHPSHEGSHFNKRLDIPQMAPGYFNSGVMLMDMDVFRQQHLVEKIISFGKAHRDVLDCPDQDALNGALCENLQPIHHKWNWHDGLTRLLLKRNAGARMSRGAALEVAVEAALRPGILHYQGPNKPWHYTYRIERKRYADVMRRSGFGIYPLPGKTLKKQIKAVLYAPVYWLTWLRIRRLYKHFQSLSKKQRL